MALNIVVIYFFVKDFSGPKFITLNFFLFYVVVMIMYWYYALLSYKLLITVEVAYYWCLKASCL